MQDYKRLFLWMCWFFGIYAGFSQEIVIVDTANHQYKKEFINLYTQRVAQQQLVFEKIPDKKIRKEVESTYKEVSTDFIENINKGFFIENESYRELLDGILDKIKTNNPDFPEISNTKILISFGVLPNAYAIGNDIVVVLVPLIKSIKNEYELAFIISHEIAHNLLQHSFNGVIEYATLKHSSELKKKTREIDKQKYNKSQIASGLYRDIVYGKRKNSRKLEHQADSLGFVLFKNAFKGYEYQAVMSLETLGEIDKELDSLSAPDYFKFFNTEKHPFKNEWINNDELSAYKYDKSPKFWQVDSLKTHPDCGLRAGFVKKHFMVQPTDLSSASENFTRLQKSSSFNHVLGLYVIEEYGKSLYKTLILLKEYPQNEFLVTMVHQNLMKLQEAQQAYTLNKYLDTVNPKYSDSYNRFLYFFRQLRKSQLNAIIEKYKTNT
jgi:hypothetical protein